MKKLFDYQTPTLKEIGLRASRVLCLSGDGTESVGIGSSSYDDSDFDQEG